MYFPNLLTVLGLTPSAAAIVTHCNTADTADLPGDQQHDWG
jgi:hypothetical protein